MPDEDANLLIFQAIWLFLASTWSKRDFSDILKLLDFSPLLGVIENGRKSCKVFTYIVNMRKKFSFQHSWKKNQKNDTPWSFKNGSFSKMAVKHLGCHWHINHLCLFFDILLLTYKWYVSYVRGCVRMHKLSKFNNKLQIWERERLREWQFFCVFATCFDVYARHVIQ